jgi:hypothetical protein
MIRVRTLGGVNGVVSMLGHLVHTPSFDERFEDAHEAGWLRRLWRAIFGGR